MPSTTKVSMRDLTPRERLHIERLAHSRTAPIRLVERARILRAAAAGTRPAVIAEQMGVSRETVYTWIHRFNEDGLVGLGDRPRSGRPNTYTPLQRADIIATARARPTDLGLPFASWTLDRLQAYLNQTKGIAIKRTRIDTILLEEGLRWHHQARWSSRLSESPLARKRRLP
jgi:transposase